MPVSAGSVNPVRTSDANEDTGGAASVIRRPCWSCARMPAAASAENIPTASCAYHPSPIMPSGTSAYRVCPLRDPRAWSGGQRKTQWMSDTKAKNE
jgi:hypothetical protein